MFIDSFARKYATDMLGPKMYSQFELKSACLKNGIREKLLGQSEFQTPVLALLVSESVVLNKGLKLKEPQFARFYLVLVKQNK